MNPPGVPKHFILQPDGSYAHPSRVRRELDPGLAQPNGGAALGREAPAPEGSRTGVGERPARKSARARRAEGRPPVLVRVHLHVRFPVRGLLDSHDNLASSLKPLVDAIAETLGVADKDPRVAWEYSQAETRGTTGVTVTVEAT